MKAIEEGVKPEFVNERLKELRSKRESLMKELEKTEEVKPFTYDKKNILNLIDLIKEKYEQLPDREKNNLLKIFIEKIVVQKNQLDIYYTFPEKKREMSAILYNTFPRHQ